MTIETQRSWEVWYNAATVRQIDDYWRGSPDEIAHRQRLAQVIKEIMPLPTASILEVGCGTGLVYEALRDAVGCDLRYTGLDNSRQMLELANWRFPKAYFEDGDAFKLPYPEDAFDIACAFEVFGHMPDCSKPIAELVRVARAVAMFTLWIGGNEIIKGIDHYEYPPDFVNEALVRATGPYKGGSWTFVDYGPVRAYIVSNA